MITVLNPGAQVLVWKFEKKHELLSLFKESVLFIYFWLRWVFVAARGLSLVVASGGYSSLQCAGFSLQ